jgi:antitoxin component of MazEF toxin-antitoxin module
MEAEEDIRRVFEIGGCLAIILPNEYVKAHGLKRGDRVRVLFNDYLHIKPIEKDELVRKLERAKSELDEK